MKLDIVPREDPSNPLLKKELGPKLSLYILKSLVWVREGQDLAYLTREEKSSNVLLKPIL